MFEWLQSRRILLTRIKDLEGKNEALLGSNNILERELSKSQGREENLLNRIFELTGVVKQKAQSLPGPKPTDFISLSKRGIPWNQVRQTLEQEAKKEYWEKKQSESEIKEKEDYGGILEDPFNGGIADADKIS